jgi:LysW-gamma-L-lysine carboxypeptidase
MDSLALLQGLLEHYSPTGEEAGAANYLVGVMGESGFSAAIDEAGNAVGVIGNGPKDILLLGHIDTVPGLITVHRQGDLLYGRGAVDAKGPLACFVSAASAVGVQPGWRVTVIGAVGEEGDSPGARYLCKSYLPPEMVIIGEPSSWDHVTLGYKGSLWAEYTLSQALSHTAGRSGSACEGAVAVWNQLVEMAADYNAPHERVFDQLTPTLRAMNSSTDGFYETARLKIGLRVPLGLSYSELQSKLDNLAESGELKLGEYTPPYRADKNTPLVRAFLAGIRAAGGQPAFCLKTGTSDMNLAGLAWNCPSVAYGPGDSNLDHTPEEHILISEYMKGIEVLTYALERLMQEETSKEVGL